MSLFRPNGTVPRETLDRAAENAPEGAFGSGHLRDLHWLLHEQQVRDGGGADAAKLRTEQVEGYAAPKDIPRHLNDMQRFINGVNWEETSRGGFVDAMSQVYAYLEQSRPLASDNEQTFAPFLDQVADKSPWTLAGNENTMDQFAALSRQQSQGLRNYPPDPRPFKQAFDQLAVPAWQARQAGLAPAAQARGTGTDQQQPAADPNAALRAAHRGANRDGGQQQNVHAR